MIKLAKPWRNSDGHAQFNTRGIPLVRAHFGEQACKTCFQSPGRHLTIAFTVAFRRSDAVSLSVFRRASILDYRIVLVASPIRLPAALLRLGPPADEAWFLTLAFENQSFVFLKTSRRWHRGQQPPGPSAELTLGMEYQKKLSDTTTCQARGGRKMFNSSLHSTELVVVQPAERRWQQGRRGLASVPRVQFRSGSDLGQ